MGREAERELGVKAVRAIRYCVGEVGAVVG